MNCLENYGVALARVLVQKKNNSKIMQGWLMALAMKFEIINENHLASKYRRMAYRLKDVFRGGVSF